MRIISVIGTRPTFMKIAPIADSLRGVSGVTHRVVHTGQHYDHRRYHESLNNVTPADVFFGRQLEILSRRERIKRQALAGRRLENLTTGVI